MSKIEADLIFDGVRMTLRTFTGIAVVKMNEQGHNCQKMFLRIFWEIIYKITKDRQPDTIITDDRMKMLLSLCHKYKVNTEGLE